MEGYKNEILDKLREEFNRWEQLVAGMTEDQIVDGQLPGGWSIKDIFAHLWSWQRISVARLEAAPLDKKPDLSWFHEQYEPEAEDDLEPINAWFYKTNRDKPWASVYSDWRSQFQHLLELGRQIPEEDLIMPGKYSWIAGYSLIAVLEGTYDHHHNEHLEPLLDWLSQHGT